MENKQLEQDLESILMKNSILLKMNQKLKKELTEANLSIADLQAKFESEQGEWAQKQGKDDESSLKVLECENLKS